MRIRQAVFEVAAWSNSRKSVSGQVRRLAVAFRSELRKNKGIERFAVAVKR
jgi:hypothetical protein